MIGPCSTVRSRTRRRFVQGARRAMCPPQRSGRSSAIASSAVCWDCPSPPCWSSAPGCSRSSRSSGGSFLARGVATGRAAAGATAGPDGPVTVLGVDPRALRVIWTVLAVAGTLGLIYVLRHLLVLLAFSVFFAYLLFPLVRFLPPSLHLP